MTPLQAIILAIVEGITEFLPISSTGHLILTSYALRITTTEFVKSFEVIIQLGAILSIIVLYWRTLLYKRSYWPKLAIAFLPTAVVGFTLYPLIKGVLLSNESITLTALLVGGIILIAVELLHKEKDQHVSDLTILSNKQAFLIGIFQSFSVIPGVSRAASTIIGGMLVGTKRKTAVEFSFLLAIPTMIAASGLDLLQSFDTFTSSDISILGIGFITSFIVALFAVKYFVKYIQNHTFIPFGIYRILLAVAYWFFLIR